jgi:hypothetical protein
MLSLLNKGKNLYIKHLSHIVMISGSIGLVTGALIIPPNYYHKETFPIFPIRLYHHVSVLILCANLGAIAGIVFPISIPFALYVCYGEWKREQLYKKEKKEREERCYKRRVRRMIQERKREEREMEENERNIRTN